MIIKNSLCLFLGVLILSLAACSPSSGEIPVTASSPTSNSANSLADTNWQLLSYGVPGAETSVLAETEVTLQFGSGGQAGGFGSCNNYGAQYEITTGKVLSISEIEATLIACTAAGVMNQEGDYFAALRAANSFEISGDRLTIRYDNGQKVLNFVKLNAGTPIPTSTLPPAPTMTPTTTPSLTPSQGTINLPERIIFDEGATSATVTGQLEQDGSKEYIVHALAGQTLKVNMNLTQGKAILAIWGEDGQVLISDHAGATSFQGVLPNTQDYHISLRGSREGRTSYSMTIEIPPPVSTCGPERIKFEHGAKSATVTGQLPPSSSKEYVVHALDGQTLSVELSFTKGEALLVVRGANGNVLQSDHAKVPNFRRELPTTQDYYIEVYGYPDGETTYKMKVTIPPLQ